MRDTWVVSLGWGDPSREGKGYPLQYSGLEKSMDRGAWRVAVHRAAKSQTQLRQLGMHLGIHMCDHLLQSK